MKIFTVLLLVLMPLNVVIAGVIPTYVPSTLPNSELPPCDVPGCYVISEKISLKEAAEDKGLKIKNGLFRFRIPSNLTAISSHPSSTLTVYQYDETPYIGISTETDQDLFLRGFTSKPPSIQAFLDIIYTKAPKDYDLTGIYDKESWNALMWLKAQIVGKTNRIYLYEREGLKIYHETGADREPTRNAAWAIDPEHPNLALRLESKIKEADFKKILYSITTKSEGK